MERHQTNRGSAATDDKKNKAFSKASLILALAPLAILLIGFLFCLFLSSPAVFGDDQGVIWWIFIALITVMIPVAIVTNTLAVIFGILGLRTNKSLFGWLGIIIAALEVGAVLVARILLS